MSTFWKAYFVLFCLLILGVIISTPSDKTATTFTYIDMITSLPSLVALYGWAWRKQIANKKFWFIYAFVFIITDITYNLLLDKSTDSLSATLIGFALIGPSYIATILYGVKFNKLKS